MILLKSLVDEITLQNTILNILEDTGAINCRVKVGPESNLDSLHIDSLDVIELVMEIEDKFSVTIVDDVMSEIFKQYATIADIAKGLLELQVHNASHIDPSKFNTPSKKHTDEYYEEKIRNFLQ